MDLYDQVRKQWHKSAQILGNDLQGGSILDLMADNFPNESLAVLKDAIANCGILGSVSNRILAQITKY